MLRVHALVLGFLVLAQTQTLQCPQAADPSAPGFTFDPPRAEISAEAEASRDTATVGQTVELSAFADGNVSFVWAQLSGPGVTLDGGLTDTAEFAAPSVGADTELQFIVTVRNAAGAVGRATVSVTIQRDSAYISPFNADDPDGDGRPGGGGSGSVTGGGTGGGSGGSVVANAGGDQRATPGSPVTLNGSASTGQGLSFAWRQVVGPTVTLNAQNSSRPNFLAPLFTPGGANQLEFELTVTDRRGRTATDRVIIDIVQQSADEMPQVRIVTNVGNIIVELNPREAPITVANFLEYVDDNFYAGTIFHRVIADFVIQGGGYDVALNARDVGDPIELEADNGLQNDRGTIAMARTTDANSATSQFYINVVDNDSLNADTNPPGYAVFGEVIEGMSVVDRIASVPTEARLNFQDVPVDDIIIQRIERVSN